MAGAQSDIFRAGEVFMELGYFDKHLLNTQETKAPREKSLGVFSIDTLVFPIFKNV